MAKRTDELARVLRIVAEALPVLEQVGAALADEPSDESRRVDALIARMRAALGRAGAVARAGVVANAPERILWTRTVVTEDLARHLEPAALRRLLGDHHEEQIRWVLARDSGIERTH